MDNLKINSNFDFHAACTMLYTDLQTALLNIQSYNQQFYSSNLQNTINYIISIPAYFWLWCALPFALYILVKILSNLTVVQRSAAEIQSTSFPGFFSPKSSYKNPYNLNIFDLAKTSYRPEHTDAAIDLIDKLHYDVNTVLPSNGLTVFLCACLGGTKSLIQYMLLKGANIHSVTQDGDSALYLATYAVLNSRQPDINILDFLIAHGCNVNHQNNKGYTALHRAASKGNLRVIKCLLRHGANLNLPNKSGVYPIDSATNAGHPGVAEFLAFNISNPHVWDVVDPHTPPKIKMGLQSPVRPHIMQSPHYLRQIKQEHGYNRSAH